MKASNLKHLYRSELANAAYFVSKDLAKRTISEYILKDRAYEIARNPKFDEYQRRLATMVCMFFITREQNRERV